MPSREEKFFNQRSKFYNSKEDYERAKRPTEEAFYQRVPDFNTYLPSPEEIEQRKKDLLWLQIKGFDNSFIERVMQHDDPPITKVAFLMEVRKWSREEICRHFMEGHEPRSE